MLELVENIVLKTITTLLLLGSSLLPAPAQDKGDIEPQTQGEKQVVEEEIETNESRADGTSQENRAPSQSENDEAGRALISSSTPAIQLTDSPFTKDNHKRARDSVVNIFCILEPFGPTNPLTASGVVIDPRGVVLTNAHVAQYILLGNHLKEGTVDCSVRTGTPAQEKYRAEILYISPEWIEDHKNNIFRKNPQGTGKDDYAFLLIKESVDNSPLPQNFDYLEPETSDEKVDEEDDVLISAYPAGFLDPYTIMHILYPISTNSKIQKLYTFGDDRIDVISTGGSYLAQKGSSGGAVINKDMKLIGLLVTSTQEEETSERDLRAVTLSHINRSLDAFGGVSFYELLSSDINETAEKFNQKISPLLSDILIEEIKSR